MEKIVNNRAIQLFTLLALSLLFFYGLPIQQDEVVQFFSLKYLDENFKDINFRGGYLEYMKRLPFTDYTFVQPYLYIGNVHSFLFYPFYMLLPIMEAKFVFSFIALVLIILLMRRAYGNSSYWPFILFPPLVFTVIHDPSPMIVALTVFLVSKLAVKRLLECEKWTESILISGGVLAMLLVCLFDKVFIIFLVPGMFFFSLSGSRIHRSNMGRLLMYIGVLVLFYAYAYFFLRAGCYMRDFNSPDMGFNLKLLIESTLNKDYSLLQERVEVVKVIFQTFDYTFYLVRNLQLATFFHFFRLGLFGPLVLAVIVFLVWKNRRSLSPVHLIAKFNAETKAGTFAPADYKLSFYCLSFIAMVSTFLLLGEVRFGYHSFFLWLPLLGILLDTESGKRFFRFAVWLNLVQIVFLVFLIAVSKPPHYLQMPYLRLQRMLKETEVGAGRKKMVNFNCWNYYMIESLNRHKDYTHVTEVFFTNKHDLDRLVEFCGKRGVTLINITCDLNEKGKILDNSVERLLEGRAKNVKYMKTEEGLTFHLIDF